MRPTSFSQNMMFQNCPRAWFLKYVKKIPIIQDLSYANAGSVIHKVIQTYYDNKDITIDELKQLFNKLWIQYKLDSAKWNTDKVDFISNEKKKAQYWGMIVNSINLNLDVTSTEMKIFFPDVVGYLDVINTKTDEIFDWKSSTRSQENEEEYRMQLMFYSYLYYRKFDRLPKKVGVYYLKYSGSKSEFFITPTMEDINKIEQWHVATKAAIDEIIQTKIPPPMCEECFFFCPFKTYCAENDKKLNYTLHTIGSQLKLIGPMSSLLDKGIEKKFSYVLKDAHWIKKANPYANTTVRFWNVKNRTLPLGFKQGLLKTLSDYANYKNMELKIEHKDHRIFDENKINMPEKFLNGIKLRNYQQDAVDVVLKNKIVLLQIATAAGKTEIAIECIRKLGYKTLFVVDKIELLKQTKERIEKALGIKVGQIGHGEDNIQYITVATIQTLIKHISKYSQYLQTVRFCIMDECHKIAAASYERLSYHLTNSEYRMGISGTVHRDDGNDMKINAIVGFKQFDLSSSKLINEGWLIRPKVVFIKDYMSVDDINAIESALDGMLINLTKDYSKAYLSFISGNLSRNLVVEDVVEYNKDKKILILVKLVNHGKWLENTIPNSKYLYGGTNKKDRDKIFNDFKNNKLNVLISTISIASEGLDIPNLDIIINAAANAGNVKTIQMIGRILRKIEGKKTALYIDFVDESDFFKHASMKRKRALVKEEHNVEVIEWEKLKKNF